MTAGPGNGHVPVGGVHVPLRRWGMKHGGSLVVESRLSHLGGAGGNLGLSLVF